MENLAAVASEEVYLGTEQVTRGTSRVHLEQLKEKKNLTIVALLGDRIVGSLTLWWTGLKKMEHVRELGMLVIDGYRQIGVGNALMTYAIQWARKQGVGKIILGVFSPNKRAFRMYRKFGFKVEGRLKREHILKGKYADEYRMAPFLRCL